MSFGAFPPVEAHRVWMDPYQSLALRWVEKKGKFQPQRKQRVHREPTSPFFKDKKYHFWEIARWQNLFFVGFVNPSPFRGSARDKSGMHWTSGLSADSLPGELSYKWRYFVYERRAEDNNNFSSSCVYCCGGWANKIWIKCKQKDVKKSSQTTREEEKSFNQNFPRLTWNF